MRLVKPSFNILPHLEYPVMLRLVSKAAAACYRADPPTDWAKQEKFIAARLTAGHESIIEHVGFSVAFLVDRGITHELVRHRLASFTQESTRYCDFSSEKFGSELTFVMPPEISAVVPEGQYSRVVQAEANVEGGAAIFLVPAVEDGTGIQIDNAGHVEWLAALRNAEIAYHNARKMDMAPEIARGVLPNALAAKITMTANMREWRHIFQLRALGTTGQPHPQMVEVMDPLLREAKRRFPAFFDDL